jgi:hypothetical protein
MGKKYYTYLVVRISYCGSHWHILLCPSLRTGADSWSPLSHGPVHLQQNHNTLYKQKCFSLLYDLTDYELKLIRDVLKSSSLIIIC